MAIDTARQQQQLEDLRDQLSRIHALFEEQKKALGVTDEELAEIARQPMTPEMQSMMEKAVSDAKAAGRQAASSLQEPQSTSLAPAASARRRRGLVI